MNRRNTQTYICAISQTGAKHYLAVGTTKLQIRDLESWFTDAPTSAILSALDGMKTSLFAWIELEWVEARRALTNGWTVSKNGTQKLESCRMSGREMYTGELADILVDEIRRDQCKQQI